MSNTEKELLNPENQLKNSSTTISHAFEPKSALIFSSQQSKQNSHGFTEVALVAPSTDNLTTETNKAYLGMQHYAKAVQKRNDIVRHEAYRAAHDLAEAASQRFTRLFGNDSKS